MALLNPRFQDVGASSGQAAHWVLSTSVAGQRFAGFGPDPFTPVEDFERWCAFVGALDKASTVIAFFGPKPQGVEDFEHGWGNDLYLWELSGGASEACPFGGGLGGLVETFETAWAPTTVRTWEQVVAEQGLFGGAPTETFGAGWLALLVPWNLVPSAAATFDGGTASAETFESTAWPKATTI